MDDHRTIRDPWDSWPEWIKQKILRMHCKRRMVKNIAKELGLNKILVGAFLRSMEKTTHWEDVLSFNPSLEEIAAAAKQIKERNLAKMRDEKTCPSNDAE